MGTPFNQWHEILSQKTRNTKLSYGENLKSLSQLVLTDGQIDEQMDKITIALAR